MILASLATGRRSTSRSVLMTMLRPSELRGLVLMEEISLDIGGLRNVASEELTSARNEKGEAGFPFPLPRAFDAPPVQQDPADIM